MTEAELLHAVNLLARDRHLLLFHCRNSIGSLGKGFPDVVAAGPRGVVFAELKINGARPTPDQRYWGNMLQKSGQRWFIWRPRDLEAGVIEGVLNELAVYQQEAVQGG